MVKKRMLIISFVLFYISLLLAFIYAILRSFSPMELSEKVGGFLLEDLIIFNCLLLNLISTVLKHMIKKSKS